MVVSRAALAASSCTHCRSPILKLVPLALAPAPATAAILRCLRYAPPVTYRHLAQSRRTVRCFATSSRYTEPQEPAHTPSTLNESSQAVGETTQETTVKEDLVVEGDKIKQLEEEIAGNSDLDFLGEASEEALEDSPEVTSEETPWYLDVEAPRHSTHLFEQAPLPDLPPDPPTILRRLLTYAADDLGLDELKILDLREIDPPPALGPNLIMMFGTARSERHLHVSAGRLVRWLRSKHGVGANADGKLGPNQLKTKLRRKRKREALLGARGVRAREDEDDGIRTGWVCVNLGPVGQKKGKAVTVRDAEGRISGFGDESADLQTTVVLQMLTDAKREDLGLESLWQQILEKSRRQKAQFLADIEASLSKANKSTTSIPPADPRPIASPFGQRRYCTAMASQRRSFSQHTLGGSAVSESPSAEEFTALAAKPVLSDDEKVKLAHSLKYHPSAKLKTLTQLRRYLDRLPPDQQKAALEKSANERGSYVYLAKVAQEDLAPEDTFMHRQWLYLKAQEHGLSGYTFETIESLVDELCVSGIPLPSRNALLNLIQAAMWPAKSTPLRENLTVTLKLLRNVDARAAHQPLVTSDIITLLISSLSAHTNHESRSERNQVQLILFELLLRSNVRCPNQDELLSLLRVFSSQENWEMFWRVWSLPPLYGTYRSPKLYTFLFRQLAQTGHQANCQRALRRVIEELVLERPKIYLPRYPVLVDAAMECTRVADPTAEQVLDQIARYARNNEEEAPESLRQRANSEFVLLMSQLRQRDLIDTRGPKRGKYQTRPSLSLPMRNRHAWRRKERDDRRKKMKEMTETGQGKEEGAPSSWEIRGR
ncbi:uncharacterized protein MKZ38_008122 [Zalerion maritima]|uniref:ATPase synthesis protein 25 n=1 Tax=Zalerion maritima TaxID=339359 RepID=A0AAD5WMM9_9PEZI|nr:uncharacterized protein MKZ38_008122 [Zalerion maritima]